MNPATATRIGMVMLALLLLGLIYIHVGLIRDLWQQQALMRGGQVVQARVLEFLQAPGPRSLLPTHSVRYEMPDNIGLVQRVRTTPIGPEAAQQAEKSGQVAIRYLPARPEVQALDGQGWPLGFLTAVLVIDAALVWFAWQLRRERLAARPRSGVTYP